ncbi:MAG: nitroreductase family protein [Burkholderiaceae bacterium]
MNPTVALLTAHKSIRQYTDQALAPGVLEALIQAGQGAATSSFLQGTTVIRVTRPEVRERFVALTGGQKHIAAAPEFLVFCADLRRSYACCERHGQTPGEGMTEHFIIATVDVALFAQNVVIAAESMGLGICYIGGIRNDPALASELLGLPRGVYPVFGLAWAFRRKTPRSSRVCRCRWCSSRTPTTTARMRRSSASTMNGSGPIIKAARATRRKQAGASRCRPAGQGVAPAHARIPGQPRFHDALTRSINRHWKPTMKLYNSVGPNPHVVRMFLAEKGVELPTQDIDVRGGENRREPYLSQVNPRGQCPALALDDGQHITEITAICEYLEENIRRPR